MTRSDLPRAVADLSEGAPVLAIDDDRSVDIATLYKRLHEQLTGIAMLLVDERAAAEDIVHDVFVALHRLPIAFTDSAAAAKYVRVSVVYRCRSELRRRHTTRRYLHRLLHPGDDAVDSRLLLDEEHRDVWAAVCALPQRQREVVVLRYWSGLTEAEIATTLGISQGTVKSQASRAVAKIETALKGE